MSGMTPRYYLVKPAWVAPLLLSCLFVTVGFSHSGWWFIALPFMAMASIYAQPNLNLANGILAYLSMALGLLLIPFHEPSGQAIALGAFLGFYLSALEKRLTAKPVYADGIVSGRRS